MKKNIILVCVLTIFLSACTVATNTKIHRKVDDLVYPRINDVKLPNIKTNYLSNGIIVYTLQNKKLPLVNVTLEINAGSLLDPEDKLGLATMASNSLTYSSEKYPSERLKNICQQNAISLYSWCNNAQTYVSLDFLSEDNDLAFDILQDVTLNPTFDENDFESAKAQEISAIYRRNDESSAIAFREFSKIIFGSDNPRYKDPEIFTINNITVDDLQEYYDKYFYQKNISLTVMGDFDEKEILAKLENIYGGMRSNLPKRTISEYSKPVNNKNKVFFVNKPDVSQTWALVGHKSKVRLNDPDYPALKLMNTILGSGFNSRIYKSVRVDNGYSYSPAGFLSAPYDRDGALYLLAPTATENSIPLAKLLVEEIKKLTQEKVTLQELNYAKESYVNSQVFNYENPKKVLSLMKQLDYYGYDRNFFNDIQDKVLKVTIDDIYRVAKKYLKPEDCLYLFVGNVNEFREQATELGSIKDIDISIKENQETEVIDYEKGKTLFLNMMNNLNKNTNVTSISFDSDESVATPMGNIQTTKVNKILFPNKMHVTQKVQGQNIDVVINGNKGSYTMAGMTQPLDEVACYNLVDNLATSYFGWLNKYDEFEIGYKNDEILNDVECSLLSFKYKGMDATIYLDKTKNLPLCTESLVDTASGRMKLKTLFIDFDQTNNVKYPRKVETVMEDGTVQTSQIIRNFKINPKINESEFIVK